MYLGPTWILYKLVGNFAMTGLMKTALPGLLEVMVVVRISPQTYISSVVTSTQKGIRLLFCNQLVRFVTDSVTQVKDSSLSFSLIMFMRQ